MIALSRFISEAGITATAERAGNNPHMISSTPMHHWRVTLRIGRSRMLVPFSKGLGHKCAEPTADEVLECLAADSSSVESAEDFAEWCREFGYEDSDRSARRTYAQCQKQAMRLREFLGDSDYETLLWDTQV